VNNEPPEFFEEVMFFVFTAMAFGALWALMR